MAAYHAKEGEAGYHGQVHALVGRVMRHAARLHLAMGLTITGQENADIKTVYRYMHLKLPEGKFMKKSHRKGVRVAIRRHLSNNKQRQKAKKAKKGLGASAHRKVCTFVC